MLTDYTIAKINRKIQNELSNLDRSSISHQEQMECLERVAALKAILDPPAEVKPEPKTESLVHEICEILRNRNR